MIVGFEDGLVGSSVVGDGVDRQGRERMGDRSFQWLFDELFGDRIVEVEIGGLSDPSELFFPVY